MFDNGHTPTVPVSVRGRLPARRRAAQAPEMADFRDSPRLARLVLRKRHRGRFPRRVDMDRFESFAFAIGFVATALLTLVSQVTIV